ncbi:MAG: hypothetical protein ACYCTF_07170 [Acidiferrobacter sp.]
MLWFKRAPEAARGNSADAEAVEPVALGAELDGRVFAHKFAQFVEMLGDSGGIEPFVAALETKRQLFARALARDALDDFVPETLETLLETVMTARKRVWPSFESYGATATREAVRDLIYGTQPVGERLVTFAQVIPAVSSEGEKGERKVRRALLDVGAEMLHFRDPTRYPLMSRWVWDQATHTGALREFVKGGDTLDKVPLGSDPGVYEAGRRWLAERMAENGMYRDPEFIVDMFLAHAYADYMRALSSGMGLLNADFGGKSDPLEVVKKILGIDAARRTESRVKKVLH